MPHLTLEYSDNLAFDVQSLLGRLHSQLAATGAVRMRGLKSRAVSRSDYHIADGNPDYAFVHLGMLIREGRSPEVQHELAQAAMQVLEDTFGSRYASGHLSISVDIKEMRDGIAMTKHNIPAAGETARSNQ